MQESIWILPAEIWKNSWILSISLLDNLNIYKNPFRFMHFWWQEFLREWIPGFLLHFWPLECTHYRCILAYVLVENGTHTTGISNLNQPRATHPSVRSENFDQKINKKNKKKPKKTLFGQNFSFFLAKIVKNKKLKGLAMIFAGQENPLIIFRSKEIYIYFKTNIKIPINLLKLWEKQGFWQVSFLRAL